LYYHAVNLVGDPPDAGSMLGPTARVLKSDGQPYETHWAYQSTVVVPSWKPPTAPSPLFRAMGHASTVDVDAICARLDKGLPTVLACRVDRTFDRWDEVEGQAVLSDAPPPYSDDSAHAILAVGHGSSSGKRFLKIRNSWGRHWGVGGYAWISEQYAAARVYGTMFLEEL
jgi:hypothetical protein